MQVEMMNFSVIQRVSPQLFTQSELNDIIRDLELPKEKAELLGSRLLENNFLAAGTSMYWYRRREEGFNKLFFTGW
jgi:hypothetical protein